MDDQDRFMDDRCQRCGLTYAEHLEQQPPHVFTTVPDDRDRA